MPSPTPAIKKTFANIPCLAILWQYSGYNTQYQNSHQLEKMIGIPLYIHHGAGTMPALTTTVIPTKT